MPFNDNFKQTVLLEGLMDYYYSVIWLLKRLQALLHSFENKNPTAMLRMK